MAKRPVRLASVASETAPDAKVAEAAEKILTDLNVPYVWQGLNQEELNEDDFSLMACIFRQQIQHFLRPDLPFDPITVYPGKNHNLKSITKQFSGWPGVRFGIVDPKSGHPKIHTFPGSAPKLQHALKEATKHLAQEELPLLFDTLEHKLTDRFHSKVSGPSALVRDIEHSDAQTHERRMVDNGKSFIQDGVRYFPLSSAAPVVQAPTSTLLHWIKKETKFHGRPLQSYYFVPANQYFISEESIERAADRFIKWPSQEPTGPVTLGEKRDQSGYIGLTDAARTVGVDHHTMWRWATKETSPIESLDVIKCPASDQFYIRQKDVSALKKHVPRSGLRAGRRPQSVLQP